MTKDPHVGKHVEKHAKFQRAFTVITHQTVKRLYAQAVVPSHGYERRLATSGLPHIAATIDEFSFYGTR